LCNVLLRLVDALSVATRLRLLYAAALIMQTVSLISIRSLLCSTLGSIDDADSVAYLHTLSPLQYLGQHR
jgi:hypothetical protein